MKATLHMVFTAAVLCTACRPAGGGSPAAPAPEAALAPDGTPAPGTPDQGQESAGLAPRLLDLSGRPTNAVELEGNLGLGSAVFPFLPDRGGTMLLTEIEYDYGTCTKDTLGARVFLESFGDDGALARVYELEEMRPLRVARKEAYQLVIQLKAQQACIGAKARLAFRYFAPRKQEEEAGTGTGTGTGAGSGTGAGTGTGTGTADPVDPDRPDPCPVLADREDLPSELKGGFVLHGRRSIKDGCEPLLTWKMADNMKSLDPPACSLPKAKFEARTAAPSLFKALDSRPDFDFNLFWLRIPDPARAQKVLDAMEEGKTVDLVAGPNDCPNLPAAPTTVVMEDDLDLMLFSGDPRDACLGDRAPAEMMDIQPAESDAFQVGYQYGANDPAQFFFKLSFKIPATHASGSLAGGAKARLYNKRVRAFVSEWVALTSNASAWTLELKDPASLRRVLPYQSELELLVAPAETTPSCSVAYVVPYHRIFLDSNLNSRFTDGTRSGRSRHLLKETDLPL